MTADYVAMLRLGHSADDRAAIARGRRTPFDWKAQLRSGFGMRGEPDMFTAVRSFIKTKPESYTTRRNGGSRAI